MEEWVQRRDSRQVAPIIVAVGCPLWKIIMKFRLARPCEKSMLLSGNLVEPPYLFRGLFHVLVHGPVVPWAHAPTLT